MLFRYWIEFNKDGDIAGCYKDKPSSKNDCKEYLVKLIPINRKMEDFEESADSFLNEVKKLNKSAKKVRTEFERGVRDLRRI